MKRQIKNRPLSRENITTSFRQAWDLNPLFYYIECGNVLRLERGICFWEKISLRQGNMPGGMQLKKEVDQVFYMKEQNLSQSQISRHDQRANNGRYYYAAISGFHI